MNTPAVVIAASASIAMSFAKRADMPVDSGPPKDPSRYALGHRRWGFGEVSQPTASHAIMERIRKLLVLAERGTEHEATAAAAAAQKMMATHRLTEAILAVDTDAKDEEVGNRRQHHPRNRSLASCYGRRAQHTRIQPGVGTRARLPYHLKKNAQKGRPTQRAQGFGTRYSARTNPRNALRAIPCPARLV